MLLRRDRAVAQPVDEQIDHAAGMIGPYVSGGRAEGGDGAQQVVWVDADPHFARRGRRFQQGLERREEPLLEVGRQGVVGRVARM